MSYESWRISYQSSEQAARAAFAEIARLRAALATAERERDEARGHLREASAFASAMRLAFDRSDSRHAECVHAARRYMDAAAPAPQQGGEDE